MCEFVSFQCDLQNVLVKEIEINELCTVVISVETRRNWIVTDNKNGRACN